MNLRGKAALWVLSWKERTLCFFRFLRNLPGYWKLQREHGVEPDFYSWVMEQYSTVMNELTCGKLSKPSHDAMTVIDEIWEYMHRHFAGWADE